ncbi:MAG: dienelactone hydrolase family protein [Acidobacteriota bacterium]|nr:dienelactone hydrolase family protein [Acidobacteriota bacterium]
MNRSTRSRATKRITSRCTKGRRSPSFQDEAPIQCGPPGCGTLVNGRPEAQTILFQSGDKEIGGYLALPGGAGRHRAIIAIHEWWGLTDWVKEQATRLAANGFIVLAVDLYEGKVTANRPEARKLKRSMPQNRTILELKAAFDSMAARPDVDPKGISSVGWSMGGGLALQLAIYEPRLAACVVNYGAPATDPVEIAKITAPVLGNFGALDRGIPQADVRAFETVMKSLNKLVDIKIYSGAGHAFANPNNKRGYRPEAADDAWFRTLRFCASAACVQSAYDKI